VTLTSTDPIDALPVHWLWQDRIPLGALSLLSGREGVGKSTIALALAADITRGRLPGIYEGDPRAVVIVSSDDAPECTIAPRLMAARADLSLARLLRGVDLPRDLAALESEIVSLDAAFVVIDPLPFRLGRKTAANRSLEAVSSMAERLQVSVFGAINAKSGPPSAFPASARSVVIASGDPHVRRLTWLKSAGPPPCQLAYRIVGTTVADGITTSKVEWLGEAPLRGRR
jgi:hypothetical protein